MFQNVSNGVLKDFPNFPILVPVQRLIVCSLLFHIISAIIPVGLFNIRAILP